jgi:hypothetical protein
MFVAKTTEQAELLARCAGLVASALQIADDAGSPLVGALLQEAYDAICREVRQAAADR